LSTKWSYMYCTVPMFKYCILQFYHNIFVIFTKIT
jgi:hypothetical protein